jgi:hypothetical protein
LYQIRKIINLIFAGKSYIVFPKLRVITQAL